MDEIYRARMRELVTRIALEQHRDDEKRAHVVLTGPMWYWSAEEWYEALAYLMSERAPA